MTNAVAQIVHQLEKLPEVEQNDLAHWLMKEIASRRARSENIERSPRVEVTWQHGYGIPVVVSPRLLSAQGASEAQSFETISGIELLWLELLREEEGRE